MPVTNEEIMEKLNRIESMVAKLTKEEEKAFEEVETEKNKLYTEVEEWKTRIWEGCEFREEQAVGEENEVGRRQGEGVLTVAMVRMY